MKPVSVKALRPSTIPLLCNGDRMKQLEFHRRYQAYPEDTKFELIGGVVYMASPTRATHGLFTAELCGAFYTYKASTPGVDRNRPG